jgi:phage/conjugal plasmid C-4 type zinc finger TraR family protein
MNAQPARLLKARRQLDRLTLSIEADLHEDGAQLARTAADPLDIAQQLTQVHLVQEVSVLMDRHRADLDHALERARAGAYGVCEDCGQAIEPERLHFLPEATRCVGCQSQHVR